MVFLPGVVQSVGNLRGVLHNLLFVPFAYAVFFNMIPTFLVSWDTATRLEARFQDNWRFTRNNTYDFIVVGGGSAGSLVANRLSEFYTVLLIENGGMSNPLSLIPALSMSLRNHPQTDWRHKTIPQSFACLNSINQECLISGGRSLGGSSNLDNLAYVRGHPLDYDGWSMLTGDMSWSYSQLETFFRRTEQFIGSSTDSTGRGIDGELRVREPDFIGLGEEWVRAGQEMGYPSVDLNGRHGQGFSILQYPIRRGMRQSAYSAFLNPIRMNARLRILSHSLVTKVLFRDMSNPMAYGVEFERFGRTELAIASREVILSAGALLTPKLLMLSGIGPRMHLQQMGIPLRAELPVGQNLQDHLGVSLGPFSINSSKSFLQDRDVNPQSIANWILSGRGPLSTTGLQSIASISSTGLSFNEQPDLLLLLHGQGVSRNYGEQFARAHGLQEDEMVRFYRDSVGQDSFHIQVIAARPRSRGEVQLRSANPRDQLLINPRYLQDDADMRVLMQGVMSALRLINSTAFQSIGARLERRRLPGCESVTEGTAYWECYIRRFSLSQHSPTGTAAMGSVVDANLKVRGTRGLRVIDASVIPTQPSVPTLATTLMIAEKGADYILREHGTPPPDLGGTVLNAVFGRNGLLTRNPIQRLLSQEFDRLNPLPSLFRTNNDTNPFLRFLPLITGMEGSAGQSGFIQNLFSLFNAQTSSLLGAVLTGVRGFSRTTTLPPVRSQTSQTNLFDIIFPRRNNTITLPNPFQDIFGMRQRMLSTVPPRTITTTRRPSLSLFQALFPSIGNNSGVNPFAVLLSPTLRPATIITTTRSVLSPPVQTTTELSLPPSPTTSAPLPLVPSYGPPTTQIATNASPSFSIPIVTREATSTAVISTSSESPEESPTESGPESTESSPTLTTQNSVQIELSIESPLQEVTNSTEETESSLRAIRLVNDEAKKIRAVHQHHPIVPYEIGPKDLSTDFDYENSPSTLRQHY